MRPDVHAAWDSNRRPRGWAKLITNPEMPLAHIRGTHVDPDEDELGLHKIYNSGLIRNYQVLLLVYLGVHLRDEHCGSLMNCTTNC